MQQFVRPYLLDAVVLQDGPDVDPDVVRRRGLPALHHVLDVVQRAAVDVPLVAGGDVRVHLCHVHLSEHRRTDGRIVNGCGSAWSSCRGGIPSVNIRPI